MKEFFKIVYLSYKDLWKENKARFIFLNLSIIFSLNAMVLSIISLTR